MVQKYLKPSEYAKNSQLKCGLIKFCCYISPANMIYLQKLAKEDDRTLSRMVNIIITKWKDKNAGKR